MFSRTWFVHLQRDTLSVAVITAMYIHFDDVHSLSFEHGNMCAMMLHMLLETCVVVNHVQFMPWCPPPLRAQPQL